MLPAASDLAATTGSCWASFAAFLVFLLFFLFIADFLFYIMSLQNASVPFSGFNVPFPLTTVPFPGCNPQINCANFQAISTGCPVNVSTSGSFVP